MSLSLGHFASTALDLGCSLSLGVWVWLRRHHKHTIFHIHMVLPSGVLIMWTAGDAHTVCKSEHDVLDNMEEELFSISTKATYTHYLWHAYIKMDITKIFSPTVHVSQYFLQFISIFFLFCTTVNAIHTILILLFPLFFIFYFSSLYSITKNPIYPQVTLFLLSQYTKNVAIHISCFVTTWLIAIFRSPACMWEAVKV